MKVIRFIIAGVAALWTVAVTIGVFNNTGEHEGTRGTTQLIAGIAAILACLVFTISLFKWALNSNNTEKNNTDGEEQK